MLVLLGERPWTVIVDPLRGQFMILCRLLHLIIRHCRAPLEVHGGLGRNPRLDCSRVHFAIRKHAVASSNGICCMADSGYRYRAVILSFVNYNDSFCCGSLPSRCASLSRSLRGRLQCGADRIVSQSAPPTPFIHGEREADRIAIASLHLPSICCHQAVGL